jgi:hypothetical protein
MNKSTRSLFMIFAAAVLSFGLTACANESREHEEGSGEASHAEAASESSAVESGLYIGVGETWDVVRKGARLVLAFERASDAFVGTVTNTTSETLCAVRVEVHLSTGTELGPTERTDVRAGQSTAVRLPTAGEADCPTGAFGLQRRVKWDGQNSEYHGHA